MTRKPKKPNSTLRKIAKVKLVNGRIIDAYIPKKTHNISKHSTVLVRDNRTPNLPKLKYKAIRNVFDLAGLPLRHQARSKYGSKKPK